MIAYIVALYVLAAVLPLVGFARVLIRVNGEVQKRAAKVAERGHDSVVLEDFDDDVQKLKTAAVDARRDLRWDIVFVGTGLTFGAWASIWSLFL